MEWSSPLCAETGTNSFFNHLGFKNYRNVSTMLSACLRKKDNIPLESLCKGKVPYVRLNSQGLEEDVPFLTYNQPTSNCKPLSAKMDSFSNCSADLMKKAARWGTWTTPQVIGGFLGTKSLIGREQPLRIGILSTVNISGVFEAAQTLVTTMCAGNFEASTDIETDKPMHSLSSTASMTTDFCLKVRESLPNPEEEKTTSKGIMATFKVFEDKDQLSEEGDSSRAEEVPTYASVASKLCSLNPENFDCQLSLCKVPNKCSPASTVLDSKHIKNQNGADKKGRVHHRSKGFKNNRHLPTENGLRPNKRLCGNWTPDHKNENLTNFSVNNCVCKPYGNRQMKVKLENETNKAVIQDLYNNNALPLFSGNEASSELKKQLTFSNLGNTGKTSNCEKNENSKPRRKRRRRRKPKKKLEDNRTKGKSLESNLDDSVKLENAAVKCKQKLSTSNDVSGTSNPLELDCLTLKLSISPPICTNATVAFILGICSDVESQDSESDSESDPCDSEENERLWKIFQQSGSRIPFPTDEVNIKKQVNLAGNCSDSSDTVDSSEINPKLKGDSSLKDNRNAGEVDNLVNGTLASHLQNVNHNWSVNIEKKLDVPHQSKKPSRKVRFAEGKALCQVKPLVSWAFAHQAARKGEWENYARDRARFALRIQEVEKCVSQVLDPEHRQRIYNKFVCDKKETNGLKISKFQGIY